MSIDTTLAAIHDTRVRGHAKLIYILLAECLNERTGQCNPSTRTLAKRAGIKRDTVDAALKTLQRGGIITGHTRPGRSTTWELHPQPAPNRAPELAPKTGPHNWIPAGPENGATAGPENGATLAPKTGPEPVSNQKLKPNPPTPLAGGRRFRRSKIPAGTNPATVHLTADGRRSTRDRTLAEDLNDHSWAD